MEYVLVAAVVFGLCFLLDKGFTKVFRGKEQHKSGLSVRYNKKFGAFGLILVVLGIAGLFASGGHDVLLLIGGSVVILAGIAMIVYYMTFGIFYDNDSFVLTTLGKKSATYQFRDIQSQQLFASGGTTIIELYLTDGRSVTVQSTMEGAYPFLDKAYVGWCRQKGIDPDACDFHDPANSLWFPTAEAE